MTITERDIQLRGNANYLHDLAAALREELTTEEVDRLELDGLDAVAAELRALAHTR